MPSKYTCSVCGLDCRSPIALESHMKSKHPEAVKGTGETKAIAGIKETRIAKETKDTTAPEAEIKVQTKETVVPIAKIDDPFLSRPIEVYAHIETPETKADTNRTATEGSKDTVKTEDTAASSTAGTEETVVEPSKAEPQKKTATAIPETVTAQATQTVAGKPIVPPIHIHIPKEALPSAEGHRDQPQPEAKPSQMTPLGSISREIEVTTRGMEIQVGSAVLKCYDWVRGRGYERTFSEFINQTVEALLRKTSSRSMFQET